MFFIFTSHIIIWTDRSGLFPIIVSYLPKLIELIIYTLLLFVCFDFLMICIHTSLVCVLRLLRILLLFVLLLFVYILTLLLFVLQLQRMLIFIVVLSSLFKCVLAVMAKSFITWHKCISKCKLSIFF